jgi:hypothetical protein
LHFSISCFATNLPLAYSLLQNLTVKASVSAVTAHYIRVSDAAVVSVFISAETETSSNFRRCLAMDVRVDSCNQPLSGRPHKYIYIWLFEKSSLNSAGMIFSCCNPCTILSYIPLVSLYPSFLFP